MILLRDIGWRYWAVSAVLLILGVAVDERALLLAVALSLIHLAHFRLREGGFRPFPVQVRLAYCAWLIVALWPPLRWLIWIPVVGTPAQVLFGYCALARLLSLLPWNRREPLSWRLVTRTFLSPPVRGNVLQGLPAEP